MRYWPILFVIVFLSCQPTQMKSSVFDELQDKETVVIALSDYDLDSIPPGIGTLKKVEKLIISRDPIKSGWTIHPPLSYLDTMIDKPPYQYLPDEITELEDLHFLSISELNIKTLPARFGEMTSLDSLNLSMNKLTLANELDKLKSLKNLKHLILFGNRVDSLDVEELKRSIPGLEVVF